MGARKAAAVVEEIMELLPAVEVARRLGIHRHTLRVWLREGRLPAIRLGANTIRVSSTALDEFIRSRMMPTDAR
jgi:excisionase family DNA binding protein